MTNEIHRKSLFQCAASSMGCISSQMVSFDQMAIRRIGLGVSNKISKLTLKGLFNLCSDNTTLYTTIQKFAYVPPDIFPDCRIFFIVKKNPKKE